MIEIIIVRGKLVGVNYL